VRGSWCSQIRTGSQLSNHWDRYKPKGGDRGALLATDVVVVGEHAATRVGSSTFTSVARRSREIKQYPSSLIS
jgi:hypothetical protein